MSNEYIKDLISFSVIKYNLLYNEDYCLTIEYPYPYTGFEEEYSNDYPLLDINSCILFSRIVFHNDISLINKDTNITLEPIANYTINSFPIPPIDICEKLLDLVVHFPNWNFYIVSWYIMNKVLPPKGLHLAPYHIDLGLKNNVFSFSWAQRACPREQWAKMLNYKILIREDDWNALKGNIINFDFSEKDTYNDYNNGNYLPHNERKLNNNWSDEDIAGAETCRWICMF